ncbi:MAG: VWA domain-containing protein, partial [Micrococcales bacterium]|nr:VWA domain-containing protein [Micrococcales bacterium]
MALELPVGRLGAPSVTLFSRALVAFGAVLALVVPVLAAPTLTPPAQAVEPDEVELQFPLWGTHIAGVVAAQPLTMGGIELELAVLGPGPTWTPVGENWSTCVSDTAGFCSFFVPASYHQNHSGETWRVQTPAGSEWWVFVHNTANPASQFQTSIMNNRFGRTLQQPALHLVAPNPPLPAGCSLNVALVMDYSGSMAGYERDMTNAADVFVDALTGTDTTFTVYSFSNVSPIPGMTNRTTPISIRTQAGADQVKATYSGWRATGGTNYGPPLRNVINAGNPTDVVIFMTDGAPSDDPAGAQAANALKLAGTRVIGFGVGQVSVSPTSLQSISGRTLDSDYYLAANFAQVSTYLEEIAAGRCTAALEIEAREAPVNQNKAYVNRLTGAAASDWHYTAQVVSSGEQVDGTTDDTGLVSLPVPITPNTTTRVLVTQTTKIGWELLQQSGVNATCFLKSDQNTILSTTPGPGDSFFLDLPAGEIATCVFVNGQYFTAPLQVLSREASPNQDKSSVNATTGSPASGWHYMAAIGTTAQAQDTTNASGLAALPLPVNSATGTTTVLVTQTNKTDWELLEQSGLVATCYLTNSPSQSVTTTNAAGVPGGFYVDLPGDQAVTCVVVNGQYFTAPLQVLSREASPNQDKASVNATTGSPAQGWHYTAAIGTTAQVQDTTNASGLAALPLPVTSATGTTTVLVTQSNKTDWELLQQSGLVATCHLTNNPSQSVATTNAAGVSGGFYVDLPGDQAVTCVV